MARRDGRPGLFDGGADRACFDALAPAERESWTRAVEYYRPNQSTPGDRVLLRLELAWLVDRRLLPNAKARELLTAFARARDDAASQEANGVGSA